MKKEENIIDYENVEIVTTLAPDTYLEGDLKYDSTLKIRGQFKGTIETSGYLWVDEGAEVEADIIASSVKVGGVVKGNIDAKFKIELLTTAKLYGNIKTAKLKISDGVLFEGNCEMIS